MGREFVKSAEVVVMWCSSQPEWLVGRIAGVGCSTIAGVGCSTIAGVRCSTIAGVGCSTIAGVGCSTIAGVGCSTIAGVGCSTSVSSLRRELVASNPSFKEGPYPGFCTWHHNPIKDSFWNVRLAWMVAICAGMHTHAHTHTHARTHTHTYTHLIIWIIVLLQVGMCKCIFQRDSFVRVEGQHSVKQIQGWLEGTGAAHK